MDNLSSKKRSWNMSRIKSKDTKPELKLRKALHRMGFRYRLHDKKLPGTPDLVFSKYKAVIFVHGCFWHQHKGCKYSYKPKSNIEFWNKKFEDNINRDEKVQKLLEAQGWKVIIVWECEIKSENNLLEKIKDELIVN